MNCNRHDNTGQWVKGHSLSSGHQPESVLEAGEETSGDTESRIQDVFVLYRLQVPKVSVKLL